MIFDGPILNAGYSRLPVAFSKIYYEEKFKLWKNIGKKLYFTSFTKLEQKIY